LHGRARATGPQRGDFRITGQLDKTMADYRKFKNLKDREKIKAEYFGLQGRK